MTLAPGKPIRRRNTLLQVAESESGIVVDKIYLREYSTTEEADAYGVMEKLAEGLEPIRIAAVIEVAPARNAIVLEYVEGADLRQTLAERGPRLLSKFRPPLVELFVRARRAGFPFDSDPSNFIVAADDSGLVVVDPACRPVDIPDYSFVVFAFGVLKLAIRSPLRCHWGRLIRQLTPYYRTYCAELGGDTTVGNLHRQMAEYLSCVIRWNRMAVETESIVRRVLRYLFLIPALCALRGGLLVASKVKK